MSIVFRSDYFDDPRAKAAFERTTKAIFGLDFKRWKERGLWDTRYIAFSAFDGGECVASACVYTHNLVVEGSKMTCAQILTVGTLPEYRRMGLQRELWHRIQRWKPQGHRGFFLFTDDSAASFYGHLGLVRRVEYSYIADVPHPDREARFENRLLDVEDRGDFRLLLDLAHGRALVSQKLSYQTPNLLLFMCLYPYRKALHYLGEIDAVVIVEERKDRVRIHDIIARRIPHFSEIIPFISGFGRDRVEFLFPPEVLQSPIAERRLIDESINFVSEEFLPDGIPFPFSIRA